MMTRRDRECPTPGCDGTHARHELTCPTCWFAVPKQMRDRVYATAVFSEEGQAARAAVIVEAALKRFGVVITPADTDWGD